MNIFIEFIIQSEIKNEKQLINNKIEGKYMIVFRINDDNNIDNPNSIEIDNYYTNDMMIDTIKALAETEDMNNVIKCILEKRRKEREEKYGSFDDIEIHKPKYKFKNLVSEYEKTGKLKIC